MFNEYALLNSYFPDLHPGLKAKDRPVEKANPKRARELFKQAGYVPVKQEY